MDRSYSSLEQRMVQSYLDTLPPFTPAADGPAPAEQERFHHLIRSLYELLWAEPQLLVSRLHEDDAHPNRATAASYGKPDLKINMRKALKAVDGLLETMRRLGQDPDSAKISRRRGRSWRDWGWTRRARYRPHGRGWRPGPAVRC